MTLHETTSEYSITTHQQLLADQELSPMLNATQSLLTVNRAGRHICIQLSPRSGGFGTQFSSASCAIQVRYAH